MISPYQNVALFCGFFCNYSAPGTGEKTAECNELREAARDICVTTAWPPAISLVQVQWFLHHTVVGRQPYVSEHSTICSSNPCNYSQISDLFTSSVYCYETKTCDLPQWIGCKSPGCVCSGHGPKIAVCHVRLCSDKCCVILRYINAYLIISSFNVQVEFLPQIIQD